MHLQYSREDVQSKREAFSGIIATSQRYLYAKNGQTNHALQLAISKFIPLATSEEYTIVSKLKTAVKDMKYAEINNLVSQLETLYYEQNNSRDDKRQKK